MKEKKIRKVVYEAVDGQQFDTKEEAKEHEIELFKDAFSLKELATMLKEECKNITKCECCPFYDNKNFCCRIAINPSQWTL